MSHLKLNILGFSLYGLTTVGHPISCSTQVMMTVMNLLMMPCREETAALVWKYILRLQMDRIAVTLMQYILVWCSARAFTCQMEG